MPRQVLGKGLSALMPAKPLGQAAQVGNLEIAAISLSKLQPRQQADPLKMAELVASIKEKGVIQPVLVRVKDNGYELIAGERRLTAAKKLGFTQVPAIIRDVEDAEALQLSLIENIQREELNPLEEAQAYERLIKEFGHTQEKLAQMMGKDASSISNTLRLLKLPEEIKTALRQGLITMGHARTILAVKNLDEQDQLFKRAISEQWSVREMEQIVSRRTSGRGRRTRSILRDPQIMELEEQLQRIVGTKVRVLAGRKRGKIVLEYYSISDLERLLNLFKSIK